MLSFNTRLHRIAPKFHGTKISSNVPNCSIIDFREVVADGTHEKATLTNIHEKNFRDYWVNHEITKIFYHENWRYTVCARVYVISFPCAPPGPSHLVDVFELVGDLREWKILGLRLGLPFPTLEKIECDKRGVDNCKMAMLHEWLAKGGASRQTLASALRRMGKSRLADRVLTDNVAATDLRVPPPCTATYTPTEEPLGKINGGNLQWYCVAMLKLGTASRV